MKLAIIGYGKMGKTIERLAIAAGHEIVLVIDVENRATDFTIENLQKADVAIEFTRPESVFENLVKCFEAKLPVVSGTTGWLDKMEKAKTICNHNKSAFFYASNYSIGVNIFFAINQQLAKMMNTQPQYNPTMVEIHHTQKLDAPSGTGITLAQGILENMDRKEKWVNRKGEMPEELALESERIDKVPGTHTIKYDSIEDYIEIKHVAHSREGFAKGAIRAAEWLIGKEGIFGMKDMLGFL